MEKVKVQCFRRAIGVCFAIVGCLFGFAVRSSMGQGADPLVASRSSDSRYRVCENGKWGFIDARGRVVIAPKYIRASDFSEGLAYAVLPHGTNRHGQKAFVNIDGEIMIGPGPPREGYSRYDDWVKEFRSGRDAEWTYSDFHSGLARFLDDGSGLWGYVDKSGKLVINPQFNYASDFSEGMAHVYLPGDNSEWVINSVGQQLWQVSRGETLGDFSEGLATSYITRSDRLWSGYVDKTGRIAVAKQYRVTHDFHNGRGLTCNENHKWGYLTNEGKVAIEFKYDQASSFSNGVAFVIRDGVGEIIDPAGKTLKIAEFDSRSVDIVDSADGMFRLALPHPDPRLNELGAAGAWGAVDADGRLAIPLEFDDLGEFQNGLAYARKGAVSGYVNKNAEWVWQTENWDE